MSIEFKHDKTVVSFKKWNKKYNRISLGIVQLCVYCCTSITLHKVIRPPHRP